MKEHCSMKIARGNNMTATHRMFLVIGCIVATSFSAYGPAHGAEPQKPMNALFLVSDDLNSWLLGDSNRYAGKVIAPNLTKLAKSGVNFERAYTAAPVCSPSRTAFFSGVAPWKSGHYHNTPGANISEPLNNALSLAGAFKRAGYTTVGYGKITHGWDQKEEWDEKIGHRRDPAPPPRGCRSRSGRGRRRRARFRRPSWWRATAGP
jgi:arylsulfatase A-like enzyme